MGTLLRGVRQELPSLSTDAVLDLKYFRKNGRMCAPDRPSCIYHVFHSLQSLDLAEDEEESEAEGSDGDSSSQSHIEITGLQGPQVDVHDEPNFSEQDKLSARASKST